MQTEGGRRAMGRVGVQAYLVLLLIAAGWMRPVVVGADAPRAGYLSAWGRMSEGLLGSGYPPCCPFRPFPVPAAGLTNAVSAAVGQDHALAACSDGTVWAWGANPGGTLGFSS